MTNKIDVSMKKLLFVLMMLCAVMNVQAQTIQVGQKFWDGYELYAVQEIWLGTIVYMTTKPFSFSILWRPYGASATGLKRA